MILTIKILIILLGGLHLGIGAYLLNSLYVHNRLTEKIGDCEFITNREWANAWSLFITGLVLIFIGVISWK